MILSRGFKKLTKQLLGPCSRRTYQKFCLFKFPFADQSTKVSIPKQLVLSEDAQRALWAQAFINMIMQRPDSLSDVQKTSLHQKLLALKKPFPQHFSEHEFSKEIQMQMKAFFTINVGVPVSPIFFDQARFDSQALNRNKRITFYPTYSTTSHIFRRIHDQKSILIYGRWGIGKSLSIVLCALLTSIVRSFAVKNYKQFFIFKGLLKNFEVIYWSLQQQQTQISLLQKMLPQLQYLWDKWNIDQSILSNVQLPRFLQRLEKQKRKYQFLGDVFRFSFSKSVVVIDQINILVSMKRKLIYGDSTVQKEKLEEQIQTLDSLKRDFQHGGVHVIYNSSCNIQESLIRQTRSLNDNSLEVLTLGYKHCSIFHEPFDRDRFRNQPVQKLQRINVLELSQYFANIVQQWYYQQKLRQQQQKAKQLQEQQQNKSQTLAKAQTSTQNSLQILSQTEMHLKMEKAQKIFQNFDWTIFPNQLSISKGIKSKTINQHQIVGNIWQEENINKILNSIKQHMQTKFTFSLYKYLLKNQNVNPSQQKNREKFLDEVYDQAIEEHKRRQMKDSQMAQNPNKLQMKQNQIKNGNFIVKIPDSSFNKSIGFDKQIFSYLQSNTQQNTHEIRCLVPPQYYFMTTYFIELLVVNPQYMYKMLSQQKKQNMNVAIQSQRHSNARIFFKYCVLYLIKTQRFAFQMVLPHIEQQQTFNIEQVQFITNFWSLGSLKKELEQAKKSFLKQKNKSLMKNCILFIPKQFAKIQNQEQFLLNLVKMIRAPTPSSNPTPKQYQTNRAFDFLIVKRFKEEMKSYQYYYYFVDMTFSNSKSIKKCQNFVQNLLQLSQFRDFKNNQYISPEILKQFYDRIRFIVLSLSGNSKFLAPKFQKQYQSKLVQNLGIKFIPVNYSEQAITQKQNVGLNPDQIQSQITKIINSLSKAKKQHQEKNKE